MQDSFENLVAVEDLDDEGDLLEASVGSYLVDFELADIKHF